MPDGVPAGTDTGAKTGTSHVSALSTGRGRESAGSAYMRFGAALRSGVRRPVTSLQMHKPAPWTAPDN